MSRTEAHAPWWTRAPWLEPAHSLGCEFYMPRQWQRGIPPKACDLPESAERSANRQPRRGVDTCTWEPIWPRYRDMRKLFGHPVPRWYIEHVWHNPERVRVRDDLAKMVKEYNGEGELDDPDFPNYRARHCAGWWWD